MHKLITIVVLIYFLFLPSCHANDEVEVIQMGVITKHSFTNPAAILEACKPFANYIGKRLNKKVIITIYPELADIVEQIDNGNLHFGIISNLEYVKLAEQRNVKPLAKGLKGNSSCYKAILLVRNDSGINSIGDLKGKKFVYSSKDSSHGYLFPSLLIKTKYHMPLEQYFSEIIHTKKDPDGILAVYYKKADVVSASSLTYELMCELKPQMKRKLKVIEYSEPLVFDPIFYFEENFKEKSLIEKSKKEVLNMHNVPEGNQILMMIKIGRLESASNADYDSIRNMIIKEKNALLEMPDH